MSRRPAYYFAPPAPVAPAAPGTTYAPDATPSTWRNTGYAQSSAGAALAATPLATVGLTRPNTASAGVPPVQFPGFSPEQVPLLRAMGAADRQSPLGSRYGSSRQISLVPNATGSTLGMVKPDGTRMFQASNGGTSTISPQGTDTGDSGILVDGNSVTHDAKGNLVAAAPSGLNPAQQWNEDRRTILALYPQVGVAGSDANKKYVAAFTGGYTGKTSDGKDYAFKAGDTAGGLDLAHQLFAGTTTAAPVDGKAADEAATAQIAAAQARDKANPAPSAGEVAGRNVRNAVTGAVSSTGNGLNTASKNVGGFFQGLTGTTDAEAKNLSDANGLDSSNLGASFFKGFGQPPTPAFKPETLELDQAPGGTNAPRPLSPTGTPVAPPTNGLAATAGGAAAAAPTVDPAEELRRRQELQRQQQTRVASNQ